MRTIEEVGVAVRVQGIYFVFRGCHRAMACHHLYRHLCGPYLLVAQRALRLSAVRGARWGAAAQGQARARRMSQLSRAALAPLARVANIMPTSRHPYYRLDPYNGRSNCRTVPYTAGIPTYTKQAVRYFWPPLYVRLSCPHWPRSHG